MTDIAHNHQWRFHGSGPVQQATEDWALIHNIEACRIVYKRCIVCDEASGSLHLIFLDRIFMNGRWTSTRRMAAEELGSIIDSIETSI
jgi:hypothetical protein